MFLYVFICFYMFLYVFVCLYKTYQNDVDRQSSQLTLRLHPVVFTLEEEARVMLA
jgi:hypothetical protein